MSVIIVTGANGFLGRHTVRTLRQRGSSVIPVTRSAPVDGSGVRVARYGDFSPPANAILVHLAEPSVITGIERTGEPHVRSMLDQCQRLLAWPWRRVVYASSAVVYGDGLARPRRRDELVTPWNYYAEAKLACEAEVMAAGGVVARISNLYGRSMSPATAVSDILGQLGEPGPLRLRNGTAMRDFLYADDAARGLAALVEDDAPPGEIVNFGTGTGHRIDEVARCALALAGEAEREVVSTDPAPRESWLILDIEHTIATLGWRPTTTIEEWLEQFIAEELYAWRER